jgi:uncharacterized surface protein with fasciclin (FAS1) repeats
MGTHRLKISAGLSVLALSAAIVAQAPAAKAVNGTIPLSQVLNISNPALDRDWNDFDILVAAINFVLKAKPTSSVKVLADGTVRLTAFAPTDRAFRNLVKSLKGKFPYNESQTVAVLASLGADTLEKVLLYHVVLGDPISSATALTSSGATLKTAATETVSLLLKGKRLYLIDIGLPKVTPKVVVSGLDINLGNNQIAHAIDAVLVPTL